MTLKKDPISFVLSAGFLAIYWQSAAMAAPALAIDELTNRGATRNIALAGATAAFPNNHSAFIENPASIPFQPSLVNLSFANAAVDDTRIRSVSSDLGVENRNEFEGGLSLRLFDGTVGLGGGILTESYRLNLPVSAQNTNAIEVSQTTFPISVAAHVFNELSVGLTYTIHLTEFSRLHAEGTDAFNKDASTKYTGKTFKLSALYVVNANLALAATHRLESQFTANTDMAPNLLKPSKTQVAAVYFIPPFGTESGPFTENTIAAQLDIASFHNDDAVFHPSALLWNSDESSLEIDVDDAPVGSKLIRIPRYIPKLGIESLLFRSSDWEGQMWLGTYWEPALYNSDESRTHLTGGLEISAWFVVLRYALDIAENYKNQSLGIGVGLQF